MLSPEAYILLYDVC
ncbi:hypothetical protein F383_36655 [Gossypium arboreum]|uniref:Uncharacterized protein n=1 Tax=Gossypium arboreum TaxID=29729 RepID=A0A0B0M9V5_GOSAR|nr:hypothetical protein F383_36655 [Gossypium arboreum]